MNFLNSGTGYVLFREEAVKKTYVDKSMLIDRMYRYALETNKYIAVSRPRRFGKSVAANMISAFFDSSTAAESKKLFKGLDIGRLRNDEPERNGRDLEPPSCWTCQGKENVVRINMIELLTPELDSYQKFFQALREMLLEDLQEAYPHLDLRNEKLVSKAFDKTGEQFIFVIDEWDAVFEARFINEKEKEDYILFLKALLKDKKYVKIAYMTGILPIAKYSSGSPLNMFEEFTSFQDEIFYPYFGLTRDEIQELMLRKGLDRPSLEELAFWYDGYIRDHDGIHLYNPNSVSKALAAGGCKSHWTGTGPMNEVRDIIRNNVQDLREDVIRMTAGETLEIELGGFASEKTQVNTRDEILSAMVVYGFLTYHEKQLRIPNHELILKFREALASQPLGLNQTLKESEKLVRATLERNEKETARLLEELHDEKIPFFQYNDENSLACVILVGYLSALDTYRIEREEKAGKGFVDFTFTPLRKTDIAIILELKYNHSARNAIKCIHERDYIRRYRGYEKVLLVGINYSEKTKKHTCLTELVEQCDKQAF